MLRAAQGATNTQIAAEAGVSLPTVGLWRRNFAQRRLDGLADAPRSGRPREIDDDEIQRVLAKTLEPPPDGTTHWSVRRLAAATGISPSTVHRIWREHKLKPHQLRSFKFSNDPLVVEKVIDVVGLYLDPPAPPPPRVPRLPQPARARPPTCPAARRPRQLLHPLDPRGRTLAGPPQARALPLAAIDFYIAGYNERAKPFRWTKTADHILAKATKQQHTSGTLHQTPRTLIGPTRSGPTP